MKRQHSQITASDDDYMADGLIQQAIRHEALMKAQQRTASKKKTKPVPEVVKTKPRAVLESEKREEGLSTAIAEDNKGFKLLALMGYKKGMPIGKQASGATAIQGPSPSTSTSTSSLPVNEPLLEPLPIILKKDKTGLGVDEDRRNNHLLQEHAIEKMSTELLSNFKARMQSKFTEKKMASDVFNSLTLCKQLDVEKKIMNSEIYKNENEYDSADEKLVAEAETNVIIEKTEFAQLEVSQKLLQVLQYLRMTHMYCYYCGTQYSSTEDLNSHCPGLTEAEHE